MPRPVRVCAYAYGGGGVGNHLPVAASPVLQLAATPQKEPGEARATSRPMGHGVLAEVVADASPLLARAELHRREVLGPSGVQSSKPTTAGYIWLLYASSIVNKEV